MKRFFFSVRYIPCTFQISLNNMSIDRHDDLGYPATFQDRLSLMMLRDVPANFQHNNQIFNAEIALPSGFTWRTVLLKQHIFLSVITPNLFTCQEQTAPCQTGGTRIRVVLWLFRSEFSHRLRWVTLRGLINSFDMKSTGRSEIALDENECFTPMMWSPTNTRCSLSDTISYATNSFLSRAAGTISIFVFYFWRVDKWNILLWQGFD